MISEVFSNLEIPVRQKLLLLLPDTSLQFNSHVTKPSPAHSLFISILKTFHSSCVRLSFFPKYQKLFSFCVCPLFPTWWIHLFPGLSVLTLSLPPPPTVPSRWKYLIFAKIGCRNRRITFAALTSCHDSEMVLAVCLDVVEVSTQMMSPACVTRHCGLSRELPPAEV